MGARTLAIPSPVALAGDWNATPGHVECSGLPRVAKLALVATALQARATPKTDCASDCFALKGAAKSPLGPVSADAARMKKPRRLIARGLSTEGLAQQCP
eukprot:1446575-Pyramimonas_sp.AAC.1